MSSQPQVGETADFWYRLQPPGPYIACQRGHRAFGHTEDEVCLSEDSGTTWPHRAAFPEARHITFSVLLRNGNILFGTRERLFLSPDHLKTIEPITVQNADGSPYLPHTPQNPDRPGWYFHTLSGVNTWMIGGREVLVWGNYCNVIGGASPVNIYYSVDSGRTVKIAYAFGQDPCFADDGSEGGGRTGTLLGDPGNPVITRHLHAVAYNPQERAFYACTGDGDRPEGFECHWLRGTYDSRRDRWKWRVILSDHLNSRYKAGGITFIQGELYWISDSNGPEPYDRGIFHCAPADLGRREKHTLLFNPGVESGTLIIDGDVMLGAHCGPASPLNTGIIISRDGGRTWAQHDLAEFGKRCPTLVHPPSPDGWFRMDLRSGWISYAEVLFLKPKPV